MNSNKTTYAIYNQISGYKSDQWMRYLAQVQQVHEPVDLWDITLLHPQILRL